MTAIVTKNQRIHNAKNFIADFSGSPQENYLYLWIGKSDPWNDDIDSNIDGTIDAPIDGEYYKSHAYNEMMSMKRVLEDNMVNAIPTYLWTAGQVYQAWDDAYEQVINEGACSIVKTIYDTQFYVVTPSFNVYKCIVAGPGTSTQIPVHTDLTSIEPRRYSDGYVWHYMYTIATNDALNFYNNSYTPVREKTEQHLDQEDIEGGIFRIIVEEGGFNYDNETTTVTLEGNGSGALAEIPIDGIVDGTITKIDITLTEDQLGLNHGTGYDYARVVITDSGNGFGAKARAVLSPRGGHGFNPVEELGGYNVEIAVDVEGDEDGKFVVTNDYRKIGLIRNPLKSGGTSLLTATTANCLKYLNLYEITGTFNPDDDIIEASSEGDGVNRAVAFVDRYEFSEGSGTLYFHQNEKTGFDPFTPGIAISSNETNSATITAVHDPDYEPYSGEIIFMEHRSPIQRTKSTREEIRLVIQF